MGKKSVLKSIRSLQRRIAEHQQKIVVEQGKDVPDMGLVRHWEKEIRTFEAKVERLRKRIGRR